MLKTTAVLAVVVCLGMIGVRPAGAQDPTETSTRRPTPSSTPTRTHTVLASPSATPTFQMGGSNVLLCSAGSQDGLVCEFDSDCHGGACVLPQGVCSGGSLDGEQCETPVECLDGGSCLLAHRVCLAGDKEGVSCLRDDQCPDSICISSGLFCEGGDFDLYSCIDDESCVGEAESGSCRAPLVFLCNGGRNDGGGCRSDLDCPLGACVVAQGICGDAQTDVITCEGDVQCPGGPCIVTARVCTGGANKSLGCLVDGNCPGGSCVATGRVCIGGDFDSIACADNTSCTPADGEPGECLVPGADFFCSAGANDAQRCFFDEDCPGGSCVFSQGVCEGGPDDGNFCETSADCGSAVPCVQTQKVCLAGDFVGFGCLTNSQCGAGVVCGSSGLRCVGGNFEEFSCAVDENCCDAEGCDGGEEDGVCRSADVLLCSGGQSDSLPCSGHADCPGGACVLAQKVCDGGFDDGFGCEGDVNCSGGASCVPTSRVCSGGEDDSFGCVRSDNCRGGGTCVATGQVCDGGDPEDDEYDPFLILFSCTNDMSCGDETLRCLAPTAQGFVCTAGSRNGQSCELHDDCPGGVCVVQDVLCEGGPLDAFFCDTSADCPDGTCRATQRVCELSGFSCTNANQCDTATSEACVASGRVCENSPFGPFSCVDDFNCFDADDPNSETGACVGLTPRLCSLEAPCILAGQSVGEVLGLSVNPLSSPATFDFYLVPVAMNAAGTVVVLRPKGGDADIFVGRAVDSQILSAEAYPFASNNSEESTDSVRISPLSMPTFLEFTDQLAEFAVAVIGVGGRTSYELFNVFLGDSDPGDADCDGVVSDADREGLLGVLFDPAETLTPEGSPFGRCLGGDVNDDGVESAADLLGVAREIALP